MSPRTHITFPRQQQREQRVASTRPGKKKNALVRHNAECTEQHTACLRVGAGGGKTCAAKAWPNVTPPQHDVTDILSCARAHVCVHTPDNQSKRTHCRREFDEGGIHGCGCGLARSAKRCHGDPFKQHECAVDGFASRVLQQRTSHAQHLIQTRRKTHASDSLLRHTDRCQTERCRTKPPQAVSYQHASETTGNTWACHTDLAHSVDPHVFVSLLECCHVERRPAVRAQLSKTKRNNTKRNAHTNACRHA